MRITCPYCGEREHREFDYHGDATKVRPDGAGMERMDAWYDYVYVRANIAGPHKELWYHVHGCRAWLTVTRDTRSHEIIEVQPNRHIA